MAGFSQGFVEGRKVGSSNPIATLLRASRESFARRLAEDKRRRKEEWSLMAALLRLGMNDEFDRALRGESKRKKKTPLDVLLKRKG